MGLPGSGKTTLSQELEKYLTSRGRKVEWFNADQVRQQFNDWDFSNQGRLRQAQRMRDLADQSSAEFVICDFIAPLEEMRQIFDANWIVWLDTVDQSRYEDTNQIFEKPTKFNFCFIEQSAVEHSAIVGYQILHSKIQAIFGFGDSFIYGSDLQDCINVNSHSVWPALIAKQLGLSYYSRAHSGIGNNRILSEILTCIAEHKNSVIYAINWTWVDRYDHYDFVNDRWDAIRPTSNTSTGKLYYKHLHSELTDKFDTLTAISLAQQHLELNNCAYIMTYIDPLFLDSKWHAPSYIRYLQSSVKNKLHTFDGLGFLDWSRKHGYPESSGWHPLEQAHSAAADYWLETYQKLL